jgi:hypothetical protein
LLLRLDSKAGPRSTTSTPVAACSNCAAVRREWPALPLASPQCVFAVSRSFQSPTAEPSERYGVWPANAGKARASTRHWWESYAVGLQGAG